MAWRRPLPPTVYLPDPAAPTLCAYAAEHLQRKTAAREATARWLECVRLHLDEAVRVLGPETPLPEIGVRDVERLVEALLHRSNRRGSSLSPATVNHYLNSLSNLFRRAVADGWADRNPVQLLLCRPHAPPRTAPWLTAEEVGTLLDWMQRRVPRRPDRAAPFAFEVVATFAYTGVRSSELTGLRRDDVDLDRLLLHVRANRWRRLKSRCAERAIPIFPEFAAILERYLRRGRHSGDDLLFRSPVMARERPMANLRRIFDPLPLPIRLGGGGALPDAGEKLHVRPRLLRHSYCAARLETLDRGAPISPYTVARELGHQGLAMVLRVYADLGSLDHRTEHVSYPRSAMPR